MTLVKVVTVPKKKKARFAIESMANKTSVKRNTEVTKKAQKLNLVFAAL